MVIALHTQTGYLHNIARMLDPMLRFIGRNYRSSLKQKYLWVIVLGILPISAQV